MKHFFNFSFIISVSLFFTASSQAQILRKLEKVKASVENAAKNIEKNEEKKRQEEERINPTGVEKSAFHEQHIGRILFAKGNPNPTLANNDDYVSALDLSSPSFFNVYLEDPLYTINARTNKLKEYSVISSYFIRKHYINNELIATYSDQLEAEDFKQKAILSDVLVPASQSDFEDNEMRVGVLAHVFSSLAPGTYTFKTEYVMIKSTERASSSGSTAIESDNEEYVVASGEVDIHITAEALASYCKQYGRPKFSKGVLEGEPKLEQQLKQLVINRSKRQSIYMYASDSWKIIRGSLDRIIGREARVYYVFKNENGRCELADFVVHQAYEGNGYGAPAFGVSTFAPAFKFVVCQNY